MRNGNKSPKISHSTIGERNGKVIRNPYPGLDHYQKLITVRESTLGLPGTMYGQRP